MSDKYSVFYRAICLFFFFKNFENGIFLKKYFLTFFLRIFKKGIFLKKNNIFFFIFKGTFVKKKVCVILI